MSTKFRGVFTVMITPVDGNGTPDACDIDSGNTYNDGLRNASYAKDCEIDGAVARSMKVRMDLGLFDPPTGPYWSYGEEKIGTDASRELNLRAAGESLVLLRNPTVGGRAVLSLGEDLEVGLDDAGAVAATADIVG